MNPSKLTPSTPSVDITNYIASRSWANIWVIYFSDDQKLQHEQNHLRTIDFMYMYDCETHSLTHSPPMWVSQSSLFWSLLSTRVGELSARLIREQAEVVEVNKYPNVWKGKKCDGVYMIISIIIYHHRERLFGFHSPFHLPSAEFLSNSRFELFLKVLTYTQFHYLLVNMIIDHQAHLREGIQKKSIFFRKESSTMGGWG